MGNLEGSQGELGVLTVTLWYSGVLGGTLGILWEYFGNTLGVLWEYFGGVLWVYFGRYFGSTLGSTLGVLWRYFGNSSVSS